MLFRKLWQTALLVVAAVHQTDALSIAGTPDFMIQPYKQAPLQSIVTWDTKSIYVRGERVMLYSGEFHPFRLPVPSLWLDVFQKIKALGYNCVSFYIDWILLESKPGDFRADGIFNLEPFFQAASSAGIYLLARPGPYINAEVAGGGFPGWLARNPAPLRTRDARYLNATQNYMSRISQIIAKAQITNGGPVILVQPENEYTVAVSSDKYFPDPVYFGYVENQLRSNGIVVPLISNDASPQGYFAPGPPKQQAAVDIYGHDGYPLGFDCANPSSWPDGALPTNWRQLHLQQSSSTPYSIVEFQGGSFDPWGGPGFANCLDLINSQFERVFYKNLFSFGVSILNLYMTYGGTNWGNLGHPGGYTSYDYAAVIAEDRSVSREKYSEAKLEANFIQASPGYLTAIPQNNSNSAGAYTGNSALFTTALFGTNSSFYVVRHTGYNSLTSTTYNFTFPTSKGSFAAPQLGGVFTLNGRDSKVHVTDYDMSGVSVLYSSAEIFTWKKYGNKRVLVVYGGPGEQHELAFYNAGPAKVVEGSGVKTAVQKNSTIINFTVSPTRRIVQVGSTFVYLLDRQSTYNYWVIDLPNDPVSGNYTNTAHFISAPIVKAGYLLRTVKSSGSSVQLTGDLNQTVPIEVIGAPQPLKSLTFNGQSLKFKQDSTGVVTATATYTAPKFSLPNLSTIGWKVLNSLPEIANNYDDSLWTSATLTYTNNTARNLTTPRSLYSSDYGYHTGNLLYRGHFTSNGKESTLALGTQGGYAYGHSIWLNTTFIGSFNGADKYENFNATYTLPKLPANKPYVLTILLDTMGLDENYDAGGSDMKNPRGILSYTLSGHPASDVSWKLTGNLHGESYVDKTRGPLNEGGLFFERQGYHLPGAPTSSWVSSPSGPMSGLSSPGVAFYSTTFNLSLPAGYDIPLSFAFANDTSSSSSSAYVPSYRCQIYVNGYQFGKYVHNIGPQDSFPVPEGIWNYRGENYVGVSLWNLEGKAGGMNVKANLSLVAGKAVQSGFGTVGLSPMTGWSKRVGAY